jgi:enediyne biosynthesis protein E4
MDAFVVNLGSAATLLHNVTAAKNHWITLKLTGAKSNRDGIGAVVEIVTGATHRKRERVAGSGYLSQDDGRLHFGIGPATKVDRITVRWPSGREQVFHNVAVDRVLAVEEPK